MNFDSQSFLEKMESLLKNYRRFSVIELGKLNLKLSPEQALILECVYRQPGITPTEISQIISKDPASLTRMVDSLESKQLLRRVLSVDDRRIYCLELTEEGFEIGKKASHLFEEMRIYGMRNLSEKEKEEFQGVLDQLIDRYSV